MLVSCVWYASSSLLSGKLKELIDLSCIFCDSNGDVAQSTVFVLFLVFSYVEMLHSPQLVLFLVFSYVEMLYSQQFPLFGVFYLVW